jgi:hypothetical protein
VGLGYQHPESGDAYDAEHSIAPSRRNVSYSARREIVLSSWLVPALPIPGIGVTTALVTIHAVCTSEQTPLMETRKI